MPSNYYESEVTFMPRKKTEQVEKPFLEQLADNKRKIQKSKEKTYELTKQTDIIISNERKSRESQNTSSAFRLFNYIMDKLGWRDADKIAIPQDSSDTSKAGKKKILEPLVFDKVMTPELLDAFIRFLDDTFQGCTETKGWFAYLHDVDKSISLPADTSIKTKTTETDETSSVKETEAESDENNTLDDEEISEDDFTTADYPSEPLNKDDLVLMP